MAVAIRLLLVDDHPIVVSGLRGSLSAVDGLVVAAEAMSLDEARRVLGETDVDVGLIDIRLPDGSGLDLIGQRDRRGQVPAWIVLSSFDMPQYLAAAVRLGAAGYVLKTAALDDIVAAIRRAATGATAFDERQLLAAEQAGRLALSEREHELAALLVAGHSNDEIAREMGVATKTIEAYLSRLFERFSVASRTELALRVQRDGLLDAPAGGRVRRRDGA